MTHRFKIEDGVKVKKNHRAAINFGFEWAF